MSEAGRPHAVLCKVVSKYRPHVGSLITVRTRYSTAHIVVTSARYLADTPNDGDVTKTAVATCPFRLGGLPRIVRRPPINALESLCCGAASGTQVRVRTSFRSERPLAPIMKSMRTVGSRHRRTMCPDYRQACETRTFMATNDPTIEEIAVLGTPCADCGQPVVDIVRAVVYRRALHHSACWLEVISGDAGQPRKLTGETAPAP